MIDLGCSGKCRLRSGVFFMVAERSGDRERMDFGTRRIGGEIKLFPPPVYMVSWKSEDWSKAGGS